MKTSLLLPLTRIFSLAHWALLAVLAASISVSPLVHAQDEDDEAADEADEEADADDAAPPAAAGPAAGNAVAAPVVDDPTVKAVLASKPTTPDELLKAIVVIAELGYPQAATPLVKQLADANLGQPALVALVKKHGSGVFIKLASEPAWQPQGKALADAALDAAYSAAHDPAAITAAVAALQGATPTTFKNSVETLVAADDAGIQALLTVLADAGRQGEYAGVRRALVAIGPGAAPAVVAALDSGIESLQIEAARVLAAMSNAERLGGALARQSYAMSLYAPALAPSNSPALRAAASKALQKILGRLPALVPAANQLEHAATRGYAPADPRGDDILPVNPPEMRDVWTWDAGRGTAVKTSEPAATATLRDAERAARDAFHLTGERSISRLWLAISLEIAAASTGGLTTLPTEADSALAAVSRDGTKGILDVLELAIARGRSAGAALAARHLGNLGDKAALHSGGVRPSALVAALSAPDRRVRFAAAEAIVKLKPTESFAGASRLIEALGDLISGHGAPRALVAHPLGGEASRQAGLLATLGYDPHVATDRRRLVQSAIASGDYELILIDLSMVAPLSGQVVQQLRNDSRTARTPICVVASADEMDRAQRFARQSSLTKAIVRPIDAAAMQLQTRDLVQLASAGRTPRDERLAQAVLALDWLAAIAAEASPRYELARVENAVVSALFTPQLSSRAAVVLARFGTNLSQRSLVDLASQNVQGMELRRAALKALGESVSKFGTLLSVAEIERQYDRYNASEGRPADEIAILARILDTIEARAELDQSPALVDKSFDEPSDE